MHSITIPRLGWSMEEGVFGEWLKQPGEFVRAGDPLFVLEGEKSAQDIESIDAGILCIPGDAPQPGATVKVGQVVGYLLAEVESPPSSVGPSVVPPLRQQEPPIASPSRPTTSSPPALSVTELPRAAGPAARRLARQLGISLNTVPTPDPTGRVLSEDVQRTFVTTYATDSRATGTRRIASPRARRRANELGVDWTQVRGTGRGGRVRECDVIAAAASADVATHAAGGERGLKPTLRTAAEQAPISVGRHIPASRLRLAIAQKMHAGVHLAAPVTMTTKVDASALVQLRTQLKAQPSAQPTPSYNDIVIALVAQTLKEQPQLNACWHRDGVHSYDAIHVAIAVDTPAGLLAPVIRDADTLSIREIAARTAPLVAQARDGRLTQQELEGGTFTVSNLGMFGIDAFTPILNLPQAGILGIGRIVEEPVVRSGRITASHTLTLSLTFDHRVLDGAPAARWLQRLAERIETLTESADGVL